MSVTFCIPSKNNLRYLKTCIPSIRESSYFKENEILVYVDQDEDGTVDWLKENGVTYVKNPDPEPKGIGHAYDTMFKAAKHDLVVAFHADMVLGHHADKWMKYYKKKDNVVCATRVEPPLHPPGSEKIVVDFGTWPEDFNLEEFNEEVKAFTNNFRLTKGMFAPWMIDKSQHLGHDPIFKSVYEDADLFRRFVLAGYKMVQTWDAVVYHFTCRGGQFAGAEKMEDFQKKDEKWMSNNMLSMREYIRKWGGLFREYGPCEPKPNKKYDVSLTISDSNNIKIEQLYAIEPFFDYISVSEELANEYVGKFQIETSFDLKSKLSKSTSDIDIEVRGIQFAIQICGALEDMMEQVKEPTTFEIDGGTVRVNKIEVKNPKIKLKW